MRSRLKLFVLSACAVAASLSGLTPQGAGFVFDSTHESLTAQERDVIPVVGHERLAWEYDAPESIATSHLAFRIFIDSEPAALLDVSCELINPPAGFTCSAPMPPLSPGTHSIAVAAVDEDGATGELSAPVYAAGATGGDSALGDGLQFPVILDGVTFEARAVLMALSDPIDIATLPDGRILIAERAGRAHVVREGRLLSTATIPLLDLATDQGSGVLAVAADVPTDEPAFVFVFHSTASGGRLVRVRLHGDQFVDHAILRDGLPIAADNPHADLGIGPDERLYLALDDGGEPWRADDLGSYSGKVLRLNRDGTTPSDLPLSPVLTTGLAEPQGIAWSRDTRTGWVAFRSAGDAYWVQRLSTGSPGNTTRFQLPADIAVTDLTLFESAPDLALSDSLLLATSTPSGVLRARFHDGFTTDWLVRDSIPGIRAITSVGATIYLVTDHTLWEVSPPRSE